MSQPAPFEGLRPGDDPFTDANKLRVLALWFDKWDATAYADRQAILDEGPGHNDVQRDLRRIADALDVPNVDCTLSAPASATPDRADLATHQPAPSEGLREALTEALRAPGVLGHRFQSTTEPWDGGYAMHSAEEMVEPLLQALAERGVVLARQLAPSEGPYEWADCPCLCHRQPAPPEGLTVEGLSWPAGAARATAVRPARQSRPDNEDASSSRAPSHGEGP